MTEVQCMAKVACIAGAVYRKAGESFVYNVESLDDIPDHLEVVGAVGPGVDAPDVPPPTTVGPGVDSLILPGGQAISSADLTSADMLDKKAGARK